MSPVIDTEHALRQTARVAKLVRFEPGAQAATGPLVSTNVQDAINEIARAGVGGGPDTDPYLLVAGNQTTTGGFEFTSVDNGTFTTGTFTPNAMLGNYQAIENGGAFTIASPGIDCAIDLLVTNVSGAGSITFTGFTVGAPGDTIDTTVGHKFIVSIRQIAGIATYLVKALQ